LPANASPEEKIIAMNTFIFNEMGFRFPPHSLYAKAVDLYTFLPSVLDSRRGVCLGVSILYLCIAQRLALPLEMITPPGHIYVRHCSNDKVINIETTARGMHLDSKEYLSINNRSLQKRTIKEVIGMAHFNQASVYWQTGDYEKALGAYQKAEPYMHGDPLLKELMGYILILTGDRERGEILLREIKDIIPDYAIVKNTMAEDYLVGRVDAKGIGVIFSKVDEDRQSILIKKEALEGTIERYPHFRSGILSLAITWLQLHRLGEALETLKRFLELDTSDPEVHYYLSVLYAQRRDYTNAWNHLQQAEIIVKRHGHAPEALTELRRELLNCCPE
jgi:tetratricopeptide (TPR) repeat protein